MKWNNAMPTNAIAEAAATHGLASIAAVSFQKPLVRILVAVASRTIAAVWRFVSLIDKSRARPLPIIAVITFGVITKCPFSTANLCASANVTAFEATAAFFSPTIYTVVATATESSTLAVVFQLRIIDSIERMASFIPAFILDVLPIWSYMIAAASPSLLHIPNNVCDCLTCIL